MLRLDCEERTSGQLMMGRVGPDTKCWMCFSFFQPGCCWHVVIVARSHKPHPFGNALEIFGKAGSQQLKACFRERKLWKILSAGIAYCQNPSNGLRPAGNVGVGHIHALSRDRWWGVCPANNPILDNLVSVTKLLLYFYVRVIKNNSLHWTRI